VTVRLGADFWDRLSDIRGSLAMTLDLLPDNHPEIDPASVYLQARKQYPDDSHGASSRLGAAFCCTASLR